MAIVSDLLSSLYNYFELLNNIFIAVPNPLIYTLPLNRHLSQPMQSKILEIL